TGAIIKDEPMRTMRGRPARFSNCLTAESAAWYCRLRSSTERASQAFCTEVAAIMLIAAKATRDGMNTLARIGIWTFILGQLAHPSIGARLFLAVSQAAILKIPLAVTTE